MRCNDTFVFLGRSTRTIHREDTGKSMDFVVVTGYLPTVGEVYDFWMRPDSQPAEYSLALGSGDSVHGLFEFRPVFKSKHFKVSLVELGV